MTMKSLEDLFVEELQDIYSAEEMLSKALPKMAKAASSEKLKDAFEEHLKVTEEQMKRLEQIFEGLDMKPKAVKCEGMQGIIKEGEKMIKEKGESTVKDAALIGAAQKAEHYEIASYGTVRTYAQLLGRDDCVTLLQKSLDEESRTDEKLTQLATSEINVEAAASSG